MSDISEGLGSAIEGTLAGRAVEPKRGEGVKQDDAVSVEGACLNCGTALVGTHCHSCGQKAKVHRTISAIWHDIVHGVLHLDGKLWRTLPLLAWRPGQLTRRYIDGERAKFVSPMAMFLFSVFLMFAIFQVAGISTPTTLNGDGFSTGAAAAKEQAIETRTLARAELEELDAAQSERREELEQSIAALDKAIAAIDAGESYEFVDSDGQRQAMTMNLTGIGWLDNSIIKKWRENPSLMLYKLQNNAYKFSWLLIPISIPFVWMLFLWKRRFKAYDHAIFVTYSIAFMSLLFLALSLLALSGTVGQAVFLTLLVIPPIHIYRQLRSTYELGRLSAIWRTIVLVNMILFAVSLIFLWLLLLLGAL